MRIIPKKIKVKNTVWKCYSMPDVIVALVMFAIIFASVTTGNWAIAVILGIISVVMFMPTQDGIFYACILENGKFLFSKKKYTAAAKSAKESVDALIPLKSIRDNGLIEYAGGSFGRVIKIGQKNFGIEDAVQQNIDINYFANALKLIDGNQSADIVKIDRPVNLDAFAGELFGRLNDVRESMDSGDVKSIKDGILRERIDAIDRLNNIRKQYISDYYIVLYGTLPSLSDGKYTLKVTTGSDYSGVVGDASSKITFTFYVDRNAPTISGASTSATGKYATSSFTVRASDSVSGVESLYMKAPNSSYYSSVGSSSKTISSGSANGLYSFYAYDKAQNKSKTYYVYFDSTKPVGTLKTSIGAVSSGSYTNQSFSYTASDSGSGIKTLQYKTPGSSTWKTYTSGTTISSTSTNGWYYFRAQDKSGLYSDESKICLDTGKPTGTLYGGTKAVASGSTVTSQYVKFTAADGLSGISKVYVKKPSAVGYAVISNSSQFTANGTYSFYCTDVAGNRSDEYTITLDNTAPELICEGAEFGSIAEQSFTVTARDAGGKATLYYRHEYGKWQTSGDSCTISDKQQDGRYYFYAVDEQNNKSAELWVLFNAAELAGRFVQSDVDNSVYFTWDSDYWTATLDGEAYHKGTWIRDEGDHTIVLSNGVGKIATYNFTIDHHYVVSKTVSPSCTEQGYTIYVCSSCGATKREDFVAGTGHKYEVSEVIRPTCTEQGYTIYKCSACGATKRDDYTQASGHNYVKTEEPPTCTESGKTVYTCSACGFEYMEEGDLPSGHVYVSEIVKNATCTQDGERHHRCEKCGEEYSSVIPKTGHNYMITDEEREDGSTKRTYTCTICGNTYVQDLGNQTEKVTNYVEYLFAQYSPYMIWVFLATAGVWSIVMGVMFAIAHKNEDKEKAKKMIVNYVIGLIVIFCILVAAPYLVRGIAALVT